MDSLTLLLGIPPAAHTALLSSDTARLSNRKYFLIILFDSVPHPRPGQKVMKMTMAGLLTPEQTELVFSS